MILRNHQFESERFNGSHIRINTHVPDTLFRFAPPAGVRVIDTAKLAK